MLGLEKLSLLQKLKSFVFSLKPIIELQNKVFHGIFRNHTVKPLITNTSEEFIKCRLDNFSMSCILYYVNFSICEINKWP